MDEIINNKLRQSRGIVKEPSGYHDKHLDSTWADYTDLLIYLYGYAYKNGRVNTDEKRNIYPNIRWTLAIVFGLVIIIAITQVLLSNHIKTREPNPIPFDIAGPLGDLSKFNLTVDCDLSQIPTKAPKLRINEVPIEKSDAGNFAKTVFGFKEIDEIEDMPFGGLMIKEGNKRLELFGFTDIYYYELDTKHVINEWSETEIKAIADNFLKKLYEYWQYPTEVEVTSEAEVCPALVTTYSSGEEIIHTIGVFYKLHVKGIGIWGPGVGFVIEVADDRVVEARLIRKALSSEGDIDVTVSPLDAINKLKSGKSAQRTLGFDTAYGPLPSEGEIIIERMDLAYFVYTRAENPFTYSPLIYRIEGKIVGSLDGEIVETDFVEFEFATN